MTAEPVTRVRTVYGDRYFVATADLNGARKFQLPLYTRDGRRWTDTRAGMAAQRRHEATTLARGNIVESAPCQS